MKSYDDNPLDQIREDENSNYNGTSNNDIANEDSKTGFELDLSPEFTETEGENNFNEGNGPVSSPFKNKEIRRKKNIILTAIGICLFGAAAAGVIMLHEMGFFKADAFPPSYFGYEIKTTDRDKNRNGQDDYQDILEGAKIEARRKPSHTDKVYEGGYPPVGEGKNVDIIWRAVKNAGYDFKKLVDDDVSKDVAAYTSLEGKATPDSDFRNIKVLKVFFDRNITSLTIDIEQKAQWQPGDIIVFGDGDHIAVVSDYRNQDGYPFLIHCESKMQIYYEEDSLLRLKNKYEITGHYRWDLRVYN